MIYFIQLCLEHDELSSFGFSIIWSILVYNVLFY